MHAPSIGFQDPTDLATTTPWLFFTRFITHFCAPTFVFLSGTSIFLSMMRRGADRSARLFLLKRGMWLILVELTLVSFGWFFNPTFPIIVLQVIWAIGVAMIVMSLTTAWGVLANLIIGLAIVFGHNLLDLIPTQPNDLSGILALNILHDGLFMPINQDHFFALVYPVLPWTGIMMVGYAFGQLYTERYTVSRQRTIRLIGIAAIIGFIILRATNLYGDPLGSGYGLEVTYAAWIVLVILLYPLCTWYDGVKTRRKDVALLRYL